MLINSWFLRQAFIDSTPISDKQRQQDQGRAMPAKNEWQCRNNQRIVGLDLREEFENGQVGETD
jgi:hypothetical protein